MELLWSYIVYTHNVVVRRVGVKFRDSGSKIERNIAKHQICHTLPERRHKFVAPKDFYYDQNTKPSTVISRLLYSSIFVVPSSIGHPPHSSASPVELRLRVGPRALSGKKKRTKVKGGVEICPSGTLQRGRSLG